MNRAGRLVDWIWWSESDVSELRPLRAYCSSPGDCDVNHGMMVLTGANSSTSTVWRSCQQIHLWGEYENWRRNENLVYPSPWDFKRSLTCRKILRHGTFRLYFPSEGKCAADFIALKNPSSWPGSNPRPLGQMASTLTTIPPRRLIRAAACWLSTHSTGVTEEIKEISGCWPRHELRMPRRREWLWEKMRGISYGCLAIRWRYWGKSRQTRLGNWPPVLISYLLICGLWVKVIPAAHNIRNVVAYLSCKYLQKANESCLDTQDINHRPNELKSKVRVFAYVVKGFWPKRSIIRIKKVSKAVPLHAMEALGGRGNIAPTHSRPRH
jgi:hypothetical protein